MIVNTREAILNVIRLTSGGGGGSCIVETLLTGTGNSTTCYGDIVGDIIYIFGAYAYLNTIRTYDIVTNTLTVLPVTTSVGAGYSFCKALDDKIYILGEFDGNKANTSSRSTAKQIKCFDTITNTITYGISKTDKSYHFGGTAIVDNKIYFFGGYYTNGNYVYSNTKTICYDIETDTITYKAASFPKSYCNGIKCEVINGEIYTLNGPNGEIFQYNIATDTYTQKTATLDLQRSEYGAVINNKYYYISSTRKDFKCYDFGKDEITTVPIEDFEWFYSYLTFSYNKTLYIFTSSSLKKIQIK